MEPIVAELYAKRTGNKATDVTVLLCGQTLEIFRVERDEEVIELSL